MSTIKTDELSNVAGDKTVPMGTVVDGSAKAWVSFDGTGTVAINLSFNVSSITDNGAGDYTANFATALAVSTYCVLGISNHFNTNVDTSVRTVSAFKIITRDDNHIKADTSDINAVVHT